MSDEMDFFILLLQEYADRKGISAADVLRQWDAHAATQKIYDQYWTYHTESLENACADIDSLIATGTHAW